MSTGEATVSLRGDWVQRKATASLEVDCWLGACCSYAVVVVDISFLCRPRLGFVPGEQAYSHQDKPHRSPICEQGPVVRRVANVMTDYFEDEAQAFAKEDMKRFDVNEDGVLDREEFTQMQQERQNCRTTDFDRFDWNQSGSMDEVELAAMHVKMALKKVSFGSR